MDNDKQIGMAIDMAVFKITNENFTLEELDNFNMDLIDLVCKYDAQIGGSICLCDEDGEPIKNG